MSQVIYWAVLLDDSSKKSIELKFPPKHSKVYIEHITLSFHPDDTNNIKWTSRLKERISVSVVGYACDVNGEAVVIDGIERDDGGIPHITISCDKNTRPYYSNALLKKGFTKIDPFKITGIITKFTKSGWEI